MNSIKNAVNTALMDVINPSKAADGLHKEEARQIKIDSRFEDLLKNAQSCDKDLLKPLSNENTSDPSPVKAKSAHENDKREDEKKTTVDKKETPENIPLLFDMTKNAHPKEVKKNEKTESAVKEVKEAKKDRVMDDLTASLKSFLHNLQQAVSGKANVEIAKQADEFKSKARQTLVKMEHTGHKNEQLPMLSTLEMKELLKNTENLHKNLSKASSKPGKEIFQEMKGLTERIQETIEKLDTKKRERKVDNNGIAQAMHNAKTDVLNEEKKIFQNSNPEHQGVAIKEKNNDAASFNFSRNFSFIRDTDSAGRSEKISVNKNGTIDFSEQLKGIIERSRIVVKDGQNANMTFKLNPDNLGKMNIHMGLDNGVLHAKFTVESEEAKAILLNNIDTLKDSLSQNGVSVGSFEVNVNSQSWGKAQDDPERIVPIIMNDSPENITAEYMNSEYIHNGEINLIV